MGRKRNGRCDRKLESPDSRKRNFCTKRDSSSLPCCFNHTGVSTMNRLRHNCTTEVAEENDNTNLHKVGVAIRKPSICVIIMPNTMASWVRTPVFGYELGNINGKASKTRTDATPYVRWGNFGKKNRPRAQTNAGPTTDQKPTW